MKTLGIFKILGQSILATLGLIVYIVIVEAFLIMYCMLAGYAPDPSKGMFHIDIYAFAGFFMLVWLVFPLAIQYKRLHSFGLYMMWFLVPIAFYQLAIRLPDGDLPRYLIAYRSWLVVIGFLATISYSLLKDLRSTARPARS